MQLFLYIGLVVYVIAFPTLCVFAWFRGGLTERRVATAFVIAAIASIFADLFGNHWHGPNWGVIIVDVIFLIVLVVIARQSSRFWPLWAAASQLGGCLAHFPAIMNPAFPKELYVSTQPYWADRRERQGKTQQVKRKRASKEQSRKETTKNKE
jgi:hypothetical protein